MENLIFFVDFGDSFIDIEQLSKDLNATVAFEEKAGHQCDLTNVFTKTKDQILASCKRYLSSLRSWSQFFGILISGSLPHCVIIFRLPASWKSTTVVRDEFLRSLRSFENELGIYRGICTICVVDAKSGDPPFDNADLTVKGSSFSDEVIQLTRFRKRIVGHASTLLFDFTTGLVSVFFFTLVAGGCLRFVQEMAVKAAAKAYDDTGHDLRIFVSGIIFFALLGLFFWGFPSISAVFDRLLLFKMLSKSKNKITIGYRWLLKTIGYRRS
jgi:hypothetical protein